MASLQLEVGVSKSPELAAHGVLLAIRAIESGDRDAAARGYRDALATRFVHPDSWSNLAALAIALEDAQAARQHAMRALQLESRHADAWVNLGVASWHAGQRREAAQAMSRAIGVDPRNHAAVLNYARMLHVVGDFHQARRVLQAAGDADPGSLRIASAFAGMARLQMDHAAARSGALRALALAERTLDPRQPGRSGLRPPAGADVKAALVDTREQLQARGVDYHLMAGTLLAIAKDGRLFAHDKDIDLALPDFDPGAIAGLRESMTADGSFRAFPPPPASASGRTTVIGLVHVATGVGVDLLLPRRQRDGSMRNETGWPDTLASVLPPYAIGSLHWDGRDWPVPDPLEPYLAGMYGADWREQICTQAGVEYDRCYSDTMLTNPSRTEESIPRAVTFGLLRLLDALELRAWSKAVAYCAQLLAREELPEVRRVLARLQSAGHNGLRVDD